jgi:hypothetical protein
MRLYPDRRSERVDVIARDLAVLIALAILAKIGLEVHDAVDNLAVLGQGVETAGNAVTGGFDSAADAVDGTPLVGDRLGDALRGAGGGTGGEVADLGRGGVDAAHRLANLLGLLMFALPASLLLLWAVPPRVAQIRRLNAASQALEELTPERRRLVAMRAAFSLPYGVLLRYTPDPLGDLEAERYDALVAAELEQSGLRPP